MHLILPQNQSLSRGKYKSTFIKLDFHRERQKRFSPWDRQSILQTQKGLERHICSQMVLVLDVLVSIIHNSRGIETT